uniref:Uncharacterized protein n=1 Tax=Rhizophora mucronata TaxID=61149 RepID=A0A2P2QN08_RHIMU
MINYFEPKIERRKIIPFI